MSTDRIIQQGRIGYNRGALGTNVDMRQGNDGDSIVSQLHGRYYEQALNGNLFMAHAIVTAPVIFSTAAGTGGPLLWNGSTTVNAVILAVGVGVTTVTTAAAALGLTGNTGQAAAPGSVTAIDSRSNCMLGGANGLCTPYRIGTPTNAGGAAGGFFLPFGHLHTGALTVDNVGIAWFDIGGAIIVPPGGWVSPATSATASTTVASISLLYEEVLVRS